MKLLTSFKNIHVQSLLGNGGVSVLSFFTTAILFRNLTSHDVGVWFFFQVSVSFLDTFRQGFLTTAFIKFYSGSSESRKRQVIGSTWFIAVIITVVFVSLNVPFFFLSESIDDRSISYFLKYCSFYLILTLPIIMGNCIVRGQLRFDRLLYIRISQAMILLIGLLYLIYVDQLTITSLMITNLISVGTSSLLVIVTGWSGVKYIFFKSKTNILELYNFGKYTVATSVSTSLFGVINTYLITFLLGSSALAIYNLGYKLMEIVQIPIRSFVATALPSLSIAYNNNKDHEVIHITKKYIGTITIAIFPFLILIFFFADFAIGLTGGGQYKNTLEGAMASNIFKIASLYALIYPMDRFLAVTLDVIHKPEVNFFKIIIMLIVNAIMVSFGIFIFDDVYGAVFASVFPIIAAILISYSAIQRHYIKFKLMDSFTIGFIQLKTLIRKSLQNSY